MLVKSTLVESAGNPVNALGCGTVTHVQFVGADPDNGPCRPLWLVLSDLFLESSYRIVDAASGHSVAYPLRIGAFARPDPSI
jgi:hypothetical protein